MRSEKRFELTELHEVKDNGRILTVDEVIESLNNQNDEIDKLKNEVKKLRGQMKRREMENERSLEV